MTQPYFGMAAAVIVIPMFVTMGVNTPSISVNGPDACEMKVMAFNQYHTFDTNVPEHQDVSMDLIEVPKDICR